MPTTYSFLDESGETRLRGTLVPEPSGSILRQTLFGNGVTITNSGSADLTWDDGTAGPDQLLNLAVVAAPTVLASGVYAVTVTVQPTAPLTADGNFVATLIIDGAGADAEVTGAGFSAKVSSTPVVPLALTFYAPVGTPLVVTVQNNDGAASRDFQIAQANVQRLS